jgi:drug/metabolite transporter (DMT)-like permease
MGTNAWDSIRFLSAVDRLRCCVDHPASLTKIDNAGPLAICSLLAYLGGMFFAADVESYNIAVLNTTAGGATFLGNNAPLVVGLLTWLLTRKLPPRSFWTALLFGSAGAWLIVYIDHVHLPIRSYGDLLACLASVCFALYLVVTERV